MGSFQASMLEAFQSLREELTTKKKTEVESSFSASKPGTSSDNAAHLDLPPPRSSTNVQSEAMDVDYGPALPPRLVLNQDTSDQYVAPSEVHPKEVSYSHKKQSHRQPVDLDSVSEQLNEDSDEPRIPTSRPKKHSDKSKHKSRSRYISSSSEEDQSSVARHRSSKPSRAQPSGAATDQDLPQHDPDPPYSREVALSDMPVETPLPNDSSKASLSPPVGGRLHSFRREWLTNKCSQNMLNIITNDYVLPFRSKPNLIRFPLILSEYKAHQKDQALATCIQSLLSKNAIERVENVKSLGFYSRLFLVPKPHQRWRPVIDLSRLNTFLHVEKFKMETPESIRTSLIPGEWVSSIDLSNAYLHIPIHPNSRKYLRFCYKAQVFQFTSLPFGLATAPHNDHKGSETNGPLKRSQNSPIPGRLADQVPVAGGSPSEHTGSGRPNSVLGVDNKSGKIRTETYSGVFVRGLRIPSRFSHCKTHSREMAQTSGCDPTTQVKTCFDCKMFDVSNWVASLNGENGPGGTPSHEALSVSSQGALEISSVAGQPPSLDRSHCSPPRLVAKSLKCDERCRPSSQRPQYPTLYRRLKRRLGRSL